MSRRAVASFSAAGAVVCVCLAARVLAAEPEQNDLEGLQARASELRQQGRYAEAVPLVARIVELREREFGPEHPVTATWLNNLALLYQDSGDYARAEPIHERSLAIWEKALGPEHPHVAVSLNNLAGLYRAIGAYARAEPLYERSLAIREKALGPEHPDVAQSLNNLAGLYHATGDYARSEPLYERSLAIWEKALGSEHPDVAESLNNLAGLYDTTGDYARAEPLYERSLAIWEKALGPEHPHVAVSLNNLAGLYHTTGDYARAEPLYERSLAIWEKALGSEHPHVAQSLNNISGINWARENLREAQRLLQRAAEIEERQIAALLPTRSEEQARTYMQTLAPHTHAILSLQGANPGDLPTTRLALTTVLRRKGRVLDAAVGSLEAFREQVGPQERATLDQLLARRDALARLVLRGPGHEPLEQYRERLAALGSEIDVLEQETHRRGGALRALAAPVQLDDVQAQIPKGGALIELVAFPAFEPSPPPGGKWWGAERFGAFVLRRQGEPRWIDLGESAQLVAKVRAFREALKNQLLSPASLKASARDLYGRLLSPLEPHLKGVSLVLIAPDGVLNLVPFGALVDASDRYLVERFTLTYLTSGRDLLRFSASRAPRSEPLVIAAPDFDAVSAASQSAVPSRGEPHSGQRSADFSELGFEPLPGTREEAAAVAKLLSVDAQTGKVATEGALKRTKGPRLLHVATHGFFLADQGDPVPRNARGIQMVTAGESSSPWGAPLPGTENPLLRSGLAFAGANHLDSGNEDGILTALELAGLDLWGTQLVVLSACETGLGQVEVGEGVYGLRRAVVLAGAESQLVSLWKVSDDATQELMTAYYTRLEAGAARAGALRDVQLAMLKDGKFGHPYFWASFIPIGAWGPITFPTAPTKP